MHLHYDVACAPQYRREPVENVTLETFDVDLHYVGYRDPLISRQRIATRDAYRQCVGGVGTNMARLSALTGHHEGYLSVNVGQCCLHHGEPRPGIEFAKQRGVFGYRLECDDVTVGSHPVEELLRVQSNVRSDVPHAVARPRDPG